MSIEDKERVKILARACAELVKNDDDERQDELSVEFVAFWNNAIKYVTPLEFCRRICDELESETK